MVWIFSATQGGTATEAGILRELRAGGRKVLGVLNKVDVLDSDAEQRELADYLREQLGPVLVEVLPLSANAALVHRASKQSGNDPFRSIDDALERHFLAHARELKAELTRRRLSEALLLAKITLDSAVLELESRGAGEPLADALARATAALGKFSEDLHEGLLGLDDMLTREALAIGLVEAGEGVRRKLDRQDAEYLEATLEDVALRVLQERLAGLSGDHEVLANLLVERLVPWARGYMAGLSARGFASSLVQTTAARPPAASKPCATACAPLFGPWPTTGDSPPASSSASSSARWLGPGSARAAPREPRRCACGPPRWPASRVCSRRSIRPRPDRPESSARRPASW